MAARPSMTVRVLGTLLATTAFGACVAAALSIDAATPDPTSAADKAFVAKVSQGGMFEVAAGKLAASQGQAQDIRDSGTTEAHDHLLVGAKLKSIAAEAGIAFPSTLNAEFQTEYAGLKALEGTSFDDAYLRDMGTIHAKDGAAFAEEAANGSDPKLRAFAAETHRIVLRHVGELSAIGPAK